MAGYILAVFATLLVVSTVSANQPKVEITYSAPELAFTLDLSNNYRSAKSVEFHYTYKGLNNYARGTLTSEGWQYKTSRVNLDGVDSVGAYAVVRDGNRNAILTTQRSTFDVGDADVNNNNNDNRQVAPLPARRIRGAVIFRDDFNRLDLNNWGYEISAYGGYNWEFQVYTNSDKNVFTRNGKLYLKPTLTIDDERLHLSERDLHSGVMDVKKLWGECTESADYGCLREGRYGILPPVESGKLKSKPTLRYGIVEIRARIPRGDWIWPAIWMMPKNNVYGNWPRSGEIDIMESRGNRGYIGEKTVTSTLHWGPDAGNDRFGMTQGDVKHRIPFSQDFHVWKLDWRQDRLITYVDGEKIMDVRPDSGFWNKGRFGGSNIWNSGSNMAPFDQDFFMILNVAVGGNNGFFDDRFPYQNRKPWVNGDAHACDNFWNAHNEWYRTWKGDRAAMVIDYVEFRHHD